MRRKVHEPRGQHLDALPEGHPNLTVLAEAELLPEAD
jgi:hypothetical protein